MGQPVPRALHHRRAALLLLIALNACSAEPANVANSADARCTRLASAPVLFVHGSGLSSATWEPMLHMFMGRDYPPEFLLAVDMIPRDGDNIVAASEFIAPGVEQLLRQSAAYLADEGCGGGTPARVDIVAHSMGAVSARWYAARISPERVRTLITIAGANHGTNALCGSSGSGDRQLCPAFAPGDEPDSPQFLLNGDADSPVDETPYGVGEDDAMRISIAPTASARIMYITIRRDPDRWIVPSESARLDGAGGRFVDSAGFDSIREISPGNFLYTGAASHDELPGSARLTEFVLHVLK